MKTPTLAGVWLQLLSRLGEPRRLALGVGLTLVLTLLLSAHFLPDRVKLDLGDISPEDISAQRSGEFVDTVETNRRRIEAAQRIRSRYDEVTFAALDSLDSVSAVFSQAQSIRQEFGANPAEASARLRRARGVRLTDAAAATLVSAPPEVLERLRASATRMVTHVMDQEIRDQPDDRPRVYREVGDLVQREPFSARQRAALEEIVRAAVRPNRQINYQRTQEAREQEMASIPPVRGQIHKGELVLRRGERISQTHLDKLTALGLRNPDLDLGTLSSIALLIGLLVALAAFYVREYQPSVSSDLRHLVLLSLITVVAVLGLRIGTTALGFRVDSTLTGYQGMLWIPWAGMMVSALVSAHTGALLATLIGIGTGLSLDLELHHVAATVASSLVGVYVVSHVRDRSSLVRLVATVSGGNLVLIWVLGTFGGDKPGSLMLGSFWAVGSGLGASLLVWLGVALLERPFGLITYLGLLELSDPNRPMLRRLQMEAPGTYHHSMIVGALAESAAEAIGANALLCRVMAYYHDIGKMRRPQFFVENQRFENLHDRLNPTLSMLIITSHVRDGVELAREAKLSKPIIDGIRQHHGTGLVTYFYHQAAVTDRSTKNASLEQHFRYEGPKPQTKETAVLMLADSCEAASRCLARPTPARIEGLVRRMVQERLDDGQLDESDLTFRDVERIIASFTRTLTGILHSRIDYPKVLTTADAKRMLDVTDPAPSFQVAASTLPASEEPSQEAAAL